MSSHEIWQVEVQGNIYEASVEEIIEWINEGSVLAEDKVRKGNLRWLKADKVPEFYSFFRKTGLTGASVGVSVASYAKEIAGNNDKDIELIKSFLSEENVETEKKQSVVKSRTVSEITQKQEENALKISEGCCSRHPSVEAQFICGTCLGLFCKVCPSSFGGNVKICLDCGAMCRIFTGAVDFKSVGAINKPYPRSEFDENEKPGNLFGKFSFSDFMKAIIYPFKFKTSLIFGAIIFTVLIVGLAAVGFGISMYFPAAVCLMLANMLVFGCLANTLDNFSQGKRNLNFMPGFDDFELWDDVIHPFLLSFGVYAISFGLFFILLFGALWQTSNSENQIEAEKQKIVSAVLPRVQNILAAGGQTNQSNQQVDQLKQDSENSNDTPSKENEIAKLQKNFENEAANYKKMQQIAQQNLQVQAQSDDGTESETEKGIFDHTVGTVLRLSLIFSVPIFIAFLWGIFYLPAACAVAGYTKSFASTVNPLIAFDTIKRLGMDYFKLVIIFTAFIALVLGLNAGLQLLFASVNLPILGNLPAKALVGLFSFYFSTVFSVCLGMVLYRNSDKLNFQLK